MTETASKGNVLLVDDDKFLLDMYSMKFSQAGFVVHASLSVKDAIDVLHGGFVADAIVSDLVMPLETGFTFLEKLKAEKLAQDSIFIALSNQSDETEKQRAMALGATRYIVKASMIPSEVVAAIAEEIEKHKK